MVIGTPIRLLRLPGVASVSPKSARTTAAQSSLVLVLPTAPPIATHASGCVARVRRKMMARESAKGGECVVNFDRGKANAAQGAGRARLSRRRRRGAPPRPGSDGRRADAGSATNRAPAASERVSIVTPRTIVSGAPNISPPVAAATSSSLKAHWLIGIGVAIVAARAGRSPGS